MRQTQTILQLLRERGKKRLPLERVYRLLYNPELYLTAYGRIYRARGCHDQRSNPGNRRWHDHG
jgi:hypothetical protein